MGTRFVVNDMFLPQLAAMHTCELPARDHGEVGRAFEVDPAYGSGTYWYYAPSGTAAVAVFDLCYTCDLEFSVPTPDCLCFGSYGRNMVRYFDAAASEPTDRTLLGYSWRAQEYKQVIHAGERLSVVSFTFLDDGLARMAARMGCDPARLTRVLTGLDGRHDVLGLAALFEEVRRARPSAAVARAYYEAKMVEALALLHDQPLEEEKPAGGRVSAANRALMNRVRAHVLENLGAPIHMDELCAIACASPSKLSRLFRQIEGTSVQEYVRDARMDAACDLLAHSDLLVEQIALEVGFARQGSFSKAFKARFGISPRAYRAIARGR